MTMNGQSALLVGEVCLDFTMPSRSSEAKVRLGGIVHAARAMWAAGLPYSVAMFCPSYLTELTEDFLFRHGCSQVIQLGEIVGAPNVVAISDVREVGHQGYEDLLRNSKRVVPAAKHAPLDMFESVVIFPGRFDLDGVMAKTSPAAKITIDVAYDIDGPEALKRYIGRFRSLVISTSSELFANLGHADITGLVALAAEIGAQSFLLKENRGGSRLFQIASDRVDSIPAVLGQTVNSVGVGDAFTAIFGSLDADPLTAAWRGMQVATAYSQTTFPDDLYRDVQREFALPIEVVQNLGGVQLPWHQRPSFQVYLAAPDFSYIEKPEIDAAVAALTYHNFVVRRPIRENGEAPRDTPVGELRRFYDADVALIDQCSVIFAIPLGKDPGTLVEMGIAIDRGLPVITYDPRKENANTMVVCGSTSYSDDLDISLNELFQSLSQKLQATTK
jgi:nucleoside 2-deoxyribosyltransferase